MLNLSPQEIRITGATVFVNPSHYSGPAIDLIFC